MIFHYKTKDQAEHIKEGLIDAKTPQEAYVTLKKKGETIISIKEGGKKFSLNLDFIQRVSLKDLAVFTKQLEIMIRAGLSLVSALESLGEQTENKKLSKVSSQISKMVNGGEYFSNALSHFPGIFSRVYIGSIKLGEKSGTLEEVLSSLSSQLEKDHDLQSKIKSAMVYPAFILAALIGVMVVLLIYVVPALTKLFQELGGQLPVATRILISTSNFILKFWWLILILLGGITIGLYSWKRTRSGNRFLDLIKIRVPIFGSLVKKIYIARFSRTSATLIKAGLPLIEVLKTSQFVVNNVLYQEQIERIKTDVEGGLPLSRAIKNADLFPPMIFNLVSAGELSGNLKESFETVANFYEKEITRTTETLSSMIEPILLIIIGLAVGVAVISIIKPIYSITEMI